MACADFARVNASRRQQTRERVELQRRIARWMDVPLTSLAFVMLGLVVAQFMAPLTPAWQARIGQVQTAIWAVFAIDFVVELVTAPSKTRYLRHNWLTALSVLLPAFRSLRVLRAAQAVRGLSLVRLVSVVNRGGRALEHIARRGQLGYVVGLSVLVMLAGAGGALYFETGADGATIHTPGDALWWAATLVTTINSPLSVVTVEGRIIGLLLRVFALGLSGYVTAVIVAQVFGVGQTAADNNASLRAELEALRRELRAARAQARARPGWMTSGPPELGLGTLPAAMGRHETIDQDGHQQPPQG
jgi:voltage-gated potassium channel